MSFPIFHETPLLVSIGETSWNMIVHGKMVCLAHTCALWNSVHLLCFNKLFFWETNSVSKAEECALLCREMKWCGVCFLFCMRCTVLGHRIHLILMKVCI